MDNFQKPSAYKNVNSSEYNVIINQKLNYDYKNVVDKLSNLTTKENVCICS
jgi:hypothetical protein